jgi:hypothetical protein
MRSSAVGSLISSIGETRLLGLVTASLKATLLSVKRCIASRARDHLPLDSTKTAFTARSKNLDVPVYEGAHNSAPTLKISLDGKIPTSGSKKDTVFQNIPKSAQFFTRSKPHFGQKRDCYVSRHTLHLTID